MGTDFYLTLLSNASMDDFPENKTASFKVKLPKKLIVNENVKVGLSEIHYHNNFYNITEGNRSMFFYKNEDVVLEIQLLPGLYQSVEHIVNYLSYICRNCEFVEMGEKEFFSYDSTDKMVKVYYDTITLVNVRGPMLRSELPRMSNFYPYGRVKVHDIDGFKRDGVINVTKVTLQNRLSVQLGFPLNHNLLTTDSSVLPADLSFGYPNQALIYTNIIDYQLIGNSYAKVIKTITLNRPRKFGTSSNKSFHPVQYVELSEREIDTVSVDIRDVEGKFVPFLYGIFILTLHFSSSV